MPLLLILPSESSYANSQSDYGLASYVRQGANDYSAMMMKINVFISPLNTTRHTRHSTPKTPSKVPLYSKLNPRVKITCRATATATAPSPSMVPPKKLK